MNTNTQCWWCYWSMVAQICKINAQRINHTCPTKDKKATAPTFTLLWKFEVFSEFGSTQQRNNTMCIKPAFRTQWHIKSYFYNTSFSMQTQFIFMRLQRKITQNSDNYDVGNRERVRARDRLVLAFK